MPSSRAIGKPAKWFSRPLPATSEPVERFRFSMRFECKNDGTRYDEPEPRLFSFNNPYGACPKCQGFGNTIDFDLNLVIPNKSLTLADGAIEPWTKPKYKPLATEMRRYARAAGIPLDVPWQDLTPEQQRLHHQGRREMVGRARLLRVPGAQEVQAACARVPQPVSRIFGVPGLRRLAPAPRSAPGQGRRQGHLPDLGHDGRGGHALLRRTATDARRSRHRRPPAGRAARPAALSERCRAGIPHARPAGLDALGRRSAAHSACNVAGLAAGRNALRAG